MRSNRTRDATFLPESYSGALPVRTMPEPAIWNWRGTSISGAKGYNGGKATSEMIVEFRSEDGKPVKHLGSEELSDDATVVELLTLQAGDSVSFEERGGRQQYTVMSSQQKELFLLQSAGPESVSYLIFIVKPVSGPSSE